MGYVWSEGVTGARAEGDEARRGDVPQRARMLRCRRVQRRGVLEEVAVRGLCRSCPRAGALLPYPSSATPSPTRSCQYTPGRRSRIVGETHGLLCVSRATRSVQHRHILYSESELSDMTPCSATDASARCKCHRPLLALGVAAVCPRLIRSTHAGLGHWTTSVASHPLFLFLERFCDL